MEAGMIVCADGRAGAHASIAAALAAARDARAAGAERVGIDVEERRAALLCDIAAPGSALVSARAAGEASSSLVDLGLHRLPDLSPPERLFALDAGGPPPRALGPDAATLPIFRTSFVGRAGALAEVQRLLGAERLVTLAGPGGGGKTRLAAHAAARQAGPRRPDGVVWIDLSTVAEPERVVELAAEMTAVLVDGVVGPLRSLVAGLAERRMLVCLDNCEHVVDAVARLAAAVLEGCPEVTLLLTSREPLGLPGEVVWRVPALDDEEAFALFVARAAEVRPGFAPAADGHDAATVRALCARLDGIPLALELAAAWLRTLSPEQIEAGLDDRFALLTRGPRGAVARQATLAASMAWSHDLLAEPERVALRRLSVFAGTFDADAATAVCAGGDLTPAAALTALGRLVDQSLVATGDRPGTLRLLESVREYAGARLREAGEEAAARDRHLVHHLEVVRGVASLLDTDRDAWRAALAGRQDDLRAALAWGLERDDAALGRELAAELPWLWHITGHGHEGIATLGRAIARAPDDRSLLQARLLVGVALVADTADPLDLEYDAAQRALELAVEHGDDRLRGLCLLLSGVGLLYADLKGSRAAADDAARLGEATGDAFVRHAAVVLQGIVLSLHARHDEADPLLAAGADGLLALGERGVASTALSVRSGGALARGDLPAARALAEQAVAVAEPLAEAHRVGAARSALATVEIAAGDGDAARAALAPVVRLLDRGGNALFVPGLARARGLLALREGDAQEALRWLASEARATAGGDDGPGTYLGAAALAPLPAAQALLGRPADAAATAARALSDARAIDLPAVVAEALEQQGWLACEAGEHDEAIALHQQALAVRVEHGLRGPAVDSLEALGMVSALTDRPDMAVRVLAAAARERGRTGLAGAAPPSRRAAVAAARERAEAALGDDERAGAEAAGAALGLDEAIAYVRRAWGPRRRPASGWESLTPTELQVVRLAVGGLNNPEIGARLFMSRSTVKTHLSHAFAKVGVANRTELAAAAPERIRA